MHSSILETSLPQHCGLRCQSTVVDCVYFWSGRPHDQLVLIILLKALSLTSCFVDSIVAPPFLSRCLICLSKSPSSFVAGDYPFWYRTIGVMLDLFVKISFIICSWRLSVLISHNWCGPLLWATDANPCFSVIYILLVSFVSIVYSHLDCSCHDLCHCQWRHDPTVLSPYYCHPIGCFLLLRFRQSSCVLDCIHCNLGCGCRHIHCGCDSLVILSRSSTKFCESLRHPYLWVSVFFKVCILSVKPPLDLACGLQGLDLISDITIGLLCSC
jgi:hypothetical protein